MLKKQKQCSYCIVRKHMFRRWVLVVSRVNGSVNAICYLVYKMPDVCSSSLFRCTLVGQFSHKDNFVSRACLGHKCLVKKGRIQKRWKWFRRDGKKLLPWWQCLVLTLEIWRSQCKNKKSLKEVQGVRQGHAS